MRQVCGKLPIKICGLFLSVVSVVFCLFPLVIIAEELPCRGLKPYNNIEELLYQFYINLDSDCLFKTPVEELEKIWEIEVIYRERDMNGKYDFSRFINKPYKTEKDAFYITVNKSSKTGSNYFTLLITSPYHKQHATLFPDGEFPKMLPRPKRGLSGDVMPPAIDIAFPPPMPKIQDKYGSSLGQPFQFYWLSSNQSRIIILSGTYGVSTIIMKDSVQPHDID